MTFELDHHFDHFIAFGPGIIFMIMNSEYRATLTAHSKGILMTLYHSQSESPLANTRIKMIKVRLSSSRYCYAMIGYLSSK